MDYAQLLLGTLGELREEMLLAQPRYQAPQSIVRFRTQVYSQNGEDGMLAEIFRRIGGAASDTFIEIGAGDGVQNNTRFLLECGWTGTWAECDPKNVAAIRASWAGDLADGSLRLVSQPLDMENVAALAAASPAPRELDLLSIDIDMNTAHVWRALGHLRPRVAVIEYNALIPPSVEWEVDYDPAAAWQGDNRFGASLKRLEKIGEALGYRLIGCELTGINAFFLRKDLHAAYQEQFPFETAAEFHYEPMRTALCLKVRSPLWVRPRAAPLQVVA